MPEQIACSTADGRHGLGQLRGHPQQLLEPAPVGRVVRRVLGALHRARGVAHDEREDLEVLVRRADRRSCGEPTLRMPSMVPSAWWNGTKISSSARHASGASIVSMSATIALAGLLLPVELAVVDEVRAAVAEALGEHRLPVLPRVRGAEQRGAQRLVAVDGADDEVVPRLAIEVDDDGLEAERLARPRRRPSRARAAARRRSRSSSRRRAASAGGRRRRARRSRAARGATRPPTRRPSGGGGGARAARRCSAATTAGSNWAPAQASSSARASAARIAAAVARGRSSSRRRRRTPRRSARRAGSRRPRRRPGIRAPSQRSWLARTSGATARSGGAASEQLVADDRVPAHLRPLGVVERPGLGDDRRVDRDLADVVELGGAADEGAVERVDAEARRDARGELGDVERVLGGLRLLGAEDREDELAVALGDRRARGCAGRPAGPRRGRARRPRRPPGRRGRRRRTSSAGRARRPRGRATTARRRRGATAPPASRRGRARRRRRRGRRRGRGRPGGRRGRRAGGRPPRSRARR